MGQLVLLFASINVLLAAYFRRRILNIAKAAFADPQLSDKQAVYAQQISRATLLHLGFQLLLIFIASHFEKIWIEIILAVFAGFILGRISNENINKIRAIDVKFFDRVKLFFGFFRGASLSLLRDVWRLYTGYISLAFQRLCLLKYSFISPGSMVLSLLFS